MASAETEPAIQDAAREDNEEVAPQLEPPSAFRCGRYLLGIF